MELEDAIEKLNRMNLRVSPDGELARIPDACYFDERSVWLEIEATLIAQFAADFHGKQPDLYCFRENETFFKGKDLLNWLQEKGVRFLAQDEQPTLPFDGTRISFQDALAKLEPFADKIELRGRGGGEGLVLVFPLETAALLIEKTSPVRIALMEQGIIPGWGEFPQRPTIMGKGAAEKLANAGLQFPDCAQYCSTQPARHRT